MRIPKKKLLAGIIVLSLVGAAFATLPVFAGLEATVSATVTPRLVSVSVSPPTYAYGVLDLGTESAPSSIITATNNGSVTEQFNIKGDNTVAWTLGSTAGANTYVHKFSTDALYVTWTPLTTPTYQTLQTSVGASLTDDFKLKITVPTSTATYAQQTAPVTVQAVAL